MFKENQTIYKKGATGKPVVVKDPHEDLKVYSTTDYERFVFVGENRPLYSSHLKRLQQSIEENGYLKEQPIHVVARGTELVITDGQHRFTVCRDLGLPIYYMVKEETPEETAKAIRVVNAYSRAWKDQDYLRHFVSLNYPQYVLLQKFMQEQDIGIAVAISLLTSGGVNMSNKKDLRHDFRTGILDFNPEKYDEATKLMVPVNDIRNFHDRISSIRNQPAFLRALIILTSSKIYDHKRFLKNLDVNIISCVYCTSVEKYMTMLEEIYNYNRREGTRVALSRKGLTLIEGAVE